MTDIALTSTQRDSLSSLIDIQRLSDRTQLRLSTGRSVNSASDDAVSFFRSRSLNDRGNDFELRRDDINQGIQGLQVTIDALDSVDTLLRQLRGVAEGARSQNTTERARANDQFQEVLSQVFNLVEDASYQGLNLLNNTSNELNVRFGIRTASRLVVTGLNLVATNAAAAGNNGLFSVNVFGNAGSVDLNFILGSGFRRNSNETSALASGEASFTSIGTNNSRVAEIEDVIQRIDNAVNRVRAQAAELGTNNAILQTRLDFTESYTRSLRSGADSPCSCRS